MRLSQSLESSWRIPFFIETWCQLHVEPQVVLDWRRLDLDQPAEVTPGMRFSKFSKGPPPQENVDVCSQAFKQDKLPVTVDSSYVSFTNGRSSLSHVGLGRWEFKLWIKYTTKPAAVAGSGGGWFELRFVELFGRVAFILGIWRAMNIWEGKAMSFSSHLAFWHGFWSNINLEIPGDFFRQKHD